MSKTVVFCADGTWNGPDEDDDGDGVADSTNVYKLFCRLAGDLRPGGGEEEREKALVEGPAEVQVAKYIHGVGDSNNAIHRVIGGAFGAGVIKRIVRGYTFVSRNYAPGDAIVLAGFSRGAYTARALAGLILSQGLLKQPLTEDREQAYKLGAQAWYRYREGATRKNGLFGLLAEAAADLPDFLSRGDLKDEDLMPIAGIKAVAVWDTVGSLGLPHFLRDPRTDAFRFADTALSPRVEHGFHAVSLDEQRLDFTPTLWDGAGNVVQMLFAGAHSDVGGGYPLRDKQSGLSDIALEWMIDQLQSAGVLFDAPAADAQFAPDPCGISHQPWRHPPFDAPGRAGPRDFSKAVIKEHPSIAARMAGGAVCCEPGQAAAAYQPGNRPKP